MIDTKNQWNLLVKKGGKPLLLQIFVRPQSDPNSQCNSYAAFTLACHLPLCSAHAACNLIVNTKQCYCNSSSQSGVTPEWNWSQLYAIWHCGQSGKVIDLLVKTLLTPEVSGICAVITCCIYGTIKVVNQSTASLSESILPNHGTMVRLGFQYMS